MAILHTAFGTDLTKIRISARVTAPASQQQQKVFYLVVALIVLAAWCAHRLRFGTPVFPVDDAYITLHNAQVMHWGRDPNYVGAAPLVGATSAVHLALVALLLCFLKPLSALYVSLWLATLVYTLGLARLAFAHRAALWQAALVVAVGLLAARVPHQLLNGLETGLAMAALVWTLALASDPPSSRHWALPALCGTLPFVRPELLVVSLLILFVRALEQRKMHDLSAARRAIARDIAICAAFAAPWAIWYALSTGTPWPSTIGAKRAFFAEAGLPISVKNEWVSDLLLMYASTIGALSATAVLLPLTRLGKVGLLFCFALVGAYYLEFPGALGHYEQRYLYVLLPFLLYAAVAALVHSNGKLRLAAGGILIITLMQSLANAPGRWQEHCGGCGFTTYQLAGVARWCNSHLPAGSTLLVHDAGYISYTTHFRLVDLVGLKTPIAAAYQQQITFPSRGYGRAQAIDEIALKTRPQYLVVLQSWDTIYRITAGLRSHGWQVDPIRPDGDYKVYRLTPPSWAL